MLLRLLKIVRIIRAVRIFILYKRYVNSRDYDVKEKSGKIKTNSKTLSLNATLMADVKTSVVRSEGDLKRRSSSKHLREGVKS